MKAAYLAMLEVALVFRLAFVGCKTEVEEVEADPLNATYVWANIDLILNNDSWYGFYGRYIYSPVMTSRLGGPPWVAIAPSFYFASPKPFK